MALKIDPSALERDLRGRTLEQRAVYVSLRCLNDIDEPFVPHPGEESRELGTSTRRWWRIVFELQEAGLLSINNGTFTLRGQA